MVFGALPLFNACLKRGGYKTSIHDLNAASFSYLTEEKNLQRYLATYDAMIAELEGKSDPTNAEKLRLDSYRRLRLYRRDLLDETTSACSGLRDPERFYDPKQYRHMDRVVKTTHKFLNALTPRLDPRHKDYMADLFPWLESEAVDPYYDYYAKNFIPAMHKLEPDVIAMSCPFSIQVAPAMFMARMLRREMPTLKFVIGGTGISDCAEKVLTDPRFYDYIDYAIVGDGEEAVVDIVTAVEGKKSFDEVDALWRRDESGEVLRPVKFKNVNLDESPTPDYAEVDFSHYLLPEKAGIYTTSRGCYYGKCTFCPESFRVGFRKRSPQRVYDDVEQLVEEQGVKFLHFFDPLTPPVTLEYVAKQVARDNLDFHWYAEVKFEKIYTNRIYVEKLSKGGCAQLQFGFESGVQRVLDSMKKGNDLQKIEIILEHLRDFGITMCGTWFIGFPTEREDDARESWRFWRRHPESMHLSLYTGTFCLDHDVPVFHRPEDFGVEVVTGEHGFSTVKQLDGSDWDTDRQHTAYHVRSDIELTTCGASLLYGARYPERLYQLRAVAQVGPTSTDEPPVPDRVVRLGRENNILVYEDSQGQMQRFGYVAESQRDYLLDEIDVAVLERVGSEGKLVAGLMAEPDAPTDIRERIDLMIDRGLLESPDPLSEKARFRNPELVKQ